jgi:uncharacterized protein (DUF2141 family)
VIIYNAIFLVFSLLFPVFNTIDCKFIVSNIQSEKGKLRYIVYNSEATFMDESKAFDKKVLDLDTKFNTLTINLKIPIDGYYAIMMYQDINNNGKLDKNLLGLPKEPIAMSNNFKPKYKSPSFKDVKVLVDKNNNKFQLQLFNY